MQIKSSIKKLAKRKEQIENRVSKIIKDTLEELDQSEKHKEKRLRQYK
jgi:hypothetical protein